MPPPELPAPAHPEIDSMLSRKFGREVANYFSGSPLNRVGFLRGDTQFLSLALRHPSASFLLCNDLAPLVSDKTRLAYVKFDDVKGLIGEDVYTVEEEELIKRYDSGKSTPQMIFLGLDEGKDGVTYTPKKGTYKGAPYFAVDVTPREGVKEAAEKLIKEVEGRGLSWGKGRVMDLVAGDAAIFAEARQLLDWNLRNPFCAQCGQPTLSVNGGFKRTCPPADAKRLVGATTTNAQAPSAERPPCATRKGISNLSFPRTDPTVIMAVVNSAGTHILLGRSKRFPPHWYSTLAGFCEPAESIEEAVRREVWEEAGIHLGRVVVHSTQPWPYPANLMIGAIGQSVPNGETIDLGNDPELEDAKWYTFDEVREALRVGTSGIGEEAGPEYKEGGLRLPPSTAIAHQLITAVVQKGFISAEPKM
ncbi:NUDIX hydrolase domain-like protein [Elsinoe ampelina]|uniref:NAD(+) diphosphatase n=1 Tax=Elsinoe ampelina TaxID=302913 RepID=A0A6A6G5Q9_9PEZI|nr:NUDIX hydrolase domain-like protein [Elsinoe ampelina]